MITSDWPTIRPHWVVTRFAMAYPLYGDLLPKNNQVLHVRPGRIGALIGELQRAHHKLIVFRRFKKLHEEFDRIAERYKCAHDYAERQELLKQARKVLEEAGTLTRAVQIKLGLLSSGRGQ